MSFTICFEPGIKPVIKHLSGQHDQSSHGSWATGDGDFEDNGFGGGGDLDAAYDIYSKKYGKDKDGNPVGMDSQQVDFIEIYTEDGYKQINSKLRAGENLYEVSQQERINLINDSKFQTETALQEWRENNKKTKDYILTSDEKYEAFDEYATKNAKTIDMYVLADKNHPIIESKVAVEALDAVISEAPVLFGDKNLYRVYSDKVLSTMQKGDIIVDRGYLSTTRVNLSKNSSLREGLGSLSDTADTVAVILPNENKNGKGFAVDIWANLSNKTSVIREREKEVLLPRGTPLKFLGYKENINDEARIAVFQRVDE